MLDLRLVLKPGRWRGSRLSLSAVMHREGWKGPAFAGERDGKGRAGGKGWTNRRQGFGLSTDELREQMEPGVYRGLRGGERLDTVCVGRDDGFLCGQATIQLGVVNSAHWDVIYVTHGSSASAGHSPANMTLVVRQLPSLDNLMLIR
jgi:hypothetical protein